MRSPPSLDGRLFVLSHTNVPQVVRLVRTILAESPNALVLVHHDDRNEPFDRAAFAGEPRAHVIDRSIHGEWASFSLVEMVLLGLADLAEREVRFDWLALISGQDYPVRPLAEFEAALVASGDGLIAFDPSPGTLLARYTFAWYRFPRALSHGAVHRILGYLTRFNSRQPYVRFLSGRVGCRIGFRTRKSPLPPAWRFYKGTQWWALSGRILEYVKSFLDAHPSFIEHFREHTMMADEAFFQTIVYNAPPPFLVRNGDGRFSKWGPPGSASPEYLTSADFTEITSSGAYFARKFNNRAEGTVLDALDKYRAAQTLAWPRDERP